MQQPEYCFPHYCGINNLRNIVQRQQTNNTKIKSYDLRSIGGLCSLTNANAQGFGSQRPDLLGSN